MVRGGPPNIHLWIKFRDIQKNYYSNDTNQVTFGDLQAQNMKKRIFSLFF